MLKKKTALLLCFIGATLNGLAQESKIYTHHQKDYQDALALYNNRQYQAAQTIFDMVKVNTNDLETEANSDCQKCVGKLFRLFYGCSKAHDRQCANEAQ